MYLKSEEICGAICRGEDVSERVSQIEWQLKGHYKKQKQEMRAGEQYSFAYDQRVHAWDALYDVSPSVRAYWDSIYPHIQTPKGRYSALLRFVCSREQFLNIPQTESVRLLRTLGWTPGDVMAAFLENRHDISTLTICPDAVAEAVEADRDTALALLEGREYDRLFDRGYDAYRHFEWLDFMYLFMGFDDKAFLTTAHRRKRLCRHCQELLERLEHRAEPWEEKGEREDLDFSIFSDALLKQKHVMASAAGQRLRKGNENNGYYVLSFHVVDEVRGCGAALRFDAFNKSPDYRDEERTAREVYLYRFPYFLPFDDVPLCWRCEQRDLPEDFVKKAHRAFSRLAGFEDSKGRKK